MDTYHISDTQSAPKVDSRFSTMLHLLPNVELPVCATLIHGQGMAVFVSCKDNKEALSDQAPIVLDSPAAVHSLEVRPFGEKGV